MSVPINWAHDNTLPRHIPHGCSRLSLSSSEHSPYDALIVVLGAGGAYYFLKVRKRKPDTSGTTDLDDYDFPEDDEDEVK